VRQGDPAALIVIRQLDCALERIKNKVPAMRQQYVTKTRFCERSLVTGFNSTSPLTLRWGLADPTTMADQLRGYQTEESIRRFSELPMRLWEHFTPREGYPADGQPAAD